VEVQRTLAWSRLPAVINPLEQRLRSIDAQLRENAERQAALTVNAPRTGRWSAPTLDWRLGAEVPRGARLGRLRGGEHRRFIAVVRARDVDRLTRSARREGEVRLRGAAGEALAVRLADLRPAESRRLPSPALGWQSGGDVATDPSDPDGVTAAEPFFVLEGLLPAAATPELYLRTGVLRVALDPQPWGRQWLRRLRQLVQERYGR
jgi:putative peptide zinc metalloprotease protein